MRADKEDQNIVLIHAGGTFAAFTDRSEQALTQFAQLSIEVKSQWH